MHIGLNAHLLSSQAGYRSAGIHGYIYNTLANLAAAAPEDWRFTAMVGKGNPHTFDQMTMRPSSKDTRSPLQRILWEQLVQPRQLGEFDLYHAMAFVAPVILQTATVVTVYDLSFVHYPQALSAARRLYLRLFTGQTCRRAKRVIAISESTAHDIHETLNIPMERIDVAACGYDETQYKPLASEQVEAFRQKHTLPDRFWLFLGTLEPRKNLTTLLDAYTRLPSTERLPLILAGGKGWLYDDIFERVERYGLKDDVLFPGYIPAADLPYWYNAAEAFIFPSIFEGFGLPVLEAMACGTPVIIADASSLPEVAGESGLHVSPTDVPAWIDALRKAFHNSHWREQSIQQGLIEARRYSWRKTAQQMIISYQQALNAQHSNNRVDK